jgi:copper chaperone CopZ
VYAPPKYLIAAEGSSARLMTHEARADRSKLEAHAILSYFKPGFTIPSGKLERELHKLDGVKKIAINHLSHTVKIRYDPSVVTDQKIRAVLKRLGTRSQS